MTDGRREGRVLGSARGVYVLTISLQFRSDRRRSDAE